MNCDCEGSCCSDGVDINLVVNNIPMDYNDNEVEAKVIITKKRKSPTARITVRGPVENR